MKEERRGFAVSPLTGEAVWLTLTELQGRLSGAPTKYVMAVWENGAKKEAEGKMKIICPFCGSEIEDEPYMLLICKKCNGVVIKREAEG